MKINKIYIDEAIRIKTEYIKSLKNILKEENSIKLNKNEVDKIKNNMNIIVKEDMNDITKRLRLNNDLLKIEKIINQIQNKIKPHYEKIENLRSDADKLYTSITEKYPNISEKEIQEQISKFIQIIEK